MTIAEAFHGKPLYHSEHNFQGITPETLHNYGARREGDTFCFPDESQGCLRSDGNWPDGTERFIFVALSVAVEESGDGLA